MREAVYKAELKQLATEVKITVGFPSYNAAVVFQQTPSVQTPTANWVSACGYSVTMRTPGWTISTTA